MLIAAGAGTAKASTATQKQIRYHLKRYHHADGYIKAIGHVARRTIYSPDYRVRRKWKKAVKYLVWVRNDALDKIYVLKHPWPPHHRLWTCIGKYEGAPTSVNPNGHYGMLQMHWDWGYGIVGAASNYSQLEQEWAAEKAYIASNYSTSFLWNQWFNYNNAEGECLKYA